MLRNCLLREWKSGKSMPPETSWTTWDFPTEKRGFRSNLWFSVEKAFWGRIQRWGFRLFKLRSRLTAKVVSHSWNQTQGQKNYLVWLESKSTSFYGPISLPYLSQISMVSGELSCQLYWREGDMVLAVSFNLALHTWPTLWSHTSQAWRQVTSYIFWRYTYLPELCWISKSAASVNTSTFPEAPNPSKRWDHPWLQGWRLSDQRVQYSPNY